ncbi:MAG: YabP/YqfC family sporulation protein [Clostridiales bacterium]|nr:YabP/YqfC family sporulation protein [Clostridiales bacterium]
MLGRKIADGLELPQEVLNGTPLMTVCGSESVVVENFRCILNFSECQVIVEAKKSCYFIEGRGLKLEYIKRDIVKIKGEICQIGFKRGV